MPEKLLPVGESTTPAQLQGVPSPRAQQWGVVISIVIIIAMVVIGAFYAWGKRIAEQNALINSGVTEQPTN